MTTRGFERLVPSSIATEQTPAAQRAAIDYLLGLAVEEAQRHAVALGWHPNDDVARSARRRAAFTPDAHDPEVARLRRVGRGEPEAPATTPVPLVLVGRHRDRPPLLARILRRSP